MTTLWYYPPIRRRFTVAANQSGATETVPYRARASIQSCRNVLLRQPRLIQGNQLRGLTDAEPGLSHLSSRLLRSAGSWDPQLEVGAASGVALLPSESPACSNQIWISATTSWSSTLQQIAAKWTHESRSRWPRGPPLGRLDLVSERAPAVAGLGYEAKTAVNGGSELLIFVPRAAHSHDGFTEGARVGGASNQRTSPGRGCCDA
jgi:hypothetical protein